MVVPTPITVFTVEACPYCKQVTTSLQECQLPYTEISLSKYPQKRKDLLHLTGKVSVPQLFIHSEWIGGVDASLACLRDFANSKWQQSKHNNADEGSLESPLEKLEREVVANKSGAANGNSPTGKSRRTTNTTGNTLGGLNPRFMIPIMEEEATSDEEEDETGNDSSRCDCPECGGGEKDLHNNSCSNNSNNNNNKLALGSECHSATGSVQTNSSHTSNNSTSRIETPDGSLKTVREVTELLKEILPYGKRRWNFTTYKNCCTAEEIVDNLVDYYGGISRQTAEAFAKQLQSQHKILHHVANTKDFRDSSAASANQFFRLQCFHTPFILNSYRVWPSTKSASHPNQVLKRVLQIFRKVEQACMEGHDGLINYRIAYMCAEFSAFEDAVCELQQVDLSRLKQGAPMLAFALNVFNLFLRYSFMKVGVPVNESCRSKMMEQIKFQVGGYTFSLQEWIDGILRGNRKSPVTKTQAFPGKKDPRFVLATAVGAYAKDCRIHFAIHCWSRSRRSPPVKTFTAARMEEELAFVTLAFCEDEDNVAFNTHDDKMRLAQVFRQYKTDFLGKSGNRTAPQVVVEFLYGPRKAKLEKWLRRHSPNNQTMKLSSRTEDWTLGVSDYVAFDAGRLTPNVQKFQKFVRSSSYRSRRSSDASRCSDMGSTKDQGSVDGSSLCSSQTTASGIGRWLPAKSLKLGGKASSAASSACRPHKGDSIPKSIIRSSDGDGVLDSIIRSTAGDGMKSGETVLLHLDDGSGDF